MQNEAGIKIASVTPQDIQKKKKNNKYFFKDWFKLNTLVLSSVFI